MAKIEKKERIEKPSPYFFRPYFGKVFFFLNPEENVEVLKTVAEIAKKKYSIRKIR